MTILIRKLKRTCAICNRVFKKTSSAKTCSKRCSLILYKINAGKRKVFKKCPVCGKLSNINKSRKTCSRRCGEILRIRNQTLTLTKKYGVTNISQIDFVKEKVTKRGRYFGTKEGRKRTSNYNKTRTRPDFKKTKPEVLVESILKKNNIKYKFQYQINERSYDFKVGNTLLEVDGTYWHGKGLKFEDKNDIQKKSHHVDRYKIKLALQNGFKIKRIWEDEISENKIKELLKDEIAL